MQLQIAPISIKAKKLWFPVLCINIKWKCCTSSSEFVNYADFFGRFIGNKVTFWIIPLLVPVVQVCCCTLFNIQVVKIHGLHYIIILIVEVAYDLLDFQSLCWLNFVMEWWFHLLVTWLFSFIVRLSVHTVRMLLFVLSVSTGFYQSVHQAVNSCSCS